MPSKKKEEKPTLYEQALLERLEEYWNSAPPKHRRGRIRLCRNIPEGLEESDAREAENK